MSATNILVANNKTQTQTNKKHSNGVHIYFKFHLSFSACTHKWALVSGGKAVFKNAEHW